MTAEPLRNLSAHEVDLAGYFGRVGYTGSADPTRETLAALVTAHGNHIPFENLDPLMGIPVRDLSARALFDKLVHRRRGGFCFEQNGLMRYVLSELGFDVDALTARVVWMSPQGIDGPPTGLTHQILAVRAPGDAQRYLVDVGFGGQTPSSPLLFTAGPAQQTRHEPFRLTAVATGYLLETLLGGTWRPVYVFADEPRPPADLQLGSWYASTYPEATFVVGLSAALLTDDARWNLRGRNLTVHHRDGRAQRTRFDTAAQVLELLMNRFGIDVGGIGDVHARITEVLDL